MEQRTFSAEDLSRAFTENRERLLMLVRKSLNPVLLRRFSYEDVLAEAYAAAAHRLDYFAANAEVPFYFKFRTILLQPLTDLERKHLKAESRSSSPTCTPRVRSASPSARWRRSPNASLKTVKSDEPHGKSSRSEDSAPASRSTPKGRAFPFGNSRSGDKKIVCNPELRDAFKRVVRPETLLRLHHEAQVVHAVPFGKRTAGGVAVQLLA